MKKPTVYVEKWAGYGKWTPESCRWTPESCRKSPPGTKNRNGGRGQAWHDGRRAACAGQNDKPVKIHSSFTVLIRSGEINFHGP